ncbi:hypothetical protein Tco_1144166 [Tanacetum coccineum]
MMRVVVCRSIVGSLGNPQYTLHDQGILDSGCSRHMTGNKSFLTDYQEIDGGFVAFGGSPKGGKITRKGKIRTGKLDFEDVYLVKELKFNLFSVSQICDKKISVFFTKTECHVLSPDFKLLDKSHVLLKVPRQNNMYSFDLKNVVPSGDPLGKFDGKADEGFLVRYSINSKAFRIFNTRTRKVEENLHITFLENKPNVAGSGPDWLFDIDLLTNSMNYEPVTAGNQTNWNAGIKDNVDAVPTQQYILLPLLFDSPQSSEDAFTNDAAKLDKLLIQQKEAYDNRTNTVSTDTVNLLNTGIFSGAYDDRKDEGVIRMIERGRSLETRKMKRNLVRNQGKIWSAQGLHPREGIDYDEVFSAVAWIEAISDDAQEIPDEFYRGAHFLLRVAASRPDIMFVVCACARFQVTPKVSHLHAVKRIFRYLKGQDLFALVFEISPFDLEAFSNSDYARASLERKNPQ